ncbi:hypothetical protein A8924_5315 [Saccharopolyspora erythraea NRRL 2338]|nr:hypothetical protein A8924_5315 [Saccharopolyspora erythraea NRRL 2338]
MSESNHRRVRPILYVSSTAVLAAVLGMGVVADQTGAGPESLQADGSITSRTIKGPACKSPVGRCFVATFEGTLEGPAEFVANSVKQTPQPGMILINGNFVIHDKRGDITCIEDSLLNTAPGSDGEPDGEFVFLCEITGGTGKWAGATGHLQATGNLQGMEGAARYIGKMNVKE